MKKQPSVTSGASRGIDTENASGGGEAEASEPPALGAGEYDDLFSGDVLFDRHRREYFVVEGVEDQGIALRQGETEFFVPHSLFCPWYGSRIFQASKRSNPQLPEWI